MKKIFLFPSLALLLALNCSIVRADDDDRSDEMPDSSSQDQDSLDEAELSPYDLLKEYKSILLGSLEDCYYEFLERVEPDSYLNSPENIFIFQQILNTWYHINSHGSQFDRLLESHPDLLMGGCAISFFIRQVLNNIVQIIGMQSCSLMKGEVVINYIGNLIDSHKEMKLVNEERNDSGSSHDGNEGIDPDLDEEMKETLYNASTESSGNPLLDDLDSSNDA